jgi:hypothetical protein
MFWLIPITIVVIGAGAFLRARRRSSRDRLLTHEPVSGEWLAEKRGREESHW